MPEIRRPASETKTPWQDALQAIDVLAVRAADCQSAARATPKGIGIRIRCSAGPVRDAWIAQLRKRLGSGSESVRIPASVSAEALLGGLNIAATLQAGRPLYEKGVLARADGGVVILPMAERLEPPIAALIAAALEAATICDRDGHSHRTRFVLIALDEAADDTECLPAVLADRLALDVNLEGISIRDVDAENPKPARTSNENGGAPVGQCMSQDALLGLAELTALLPGAPLRKLLHTTEVAGILAQCDGAPDVTPVHVRDAMRLCLNLTAPDDSSQTIEDQASDPSPPPDQTGRPSTDARPEDTSEDTREIDLDQLLADMAVSAQAASDRIVDEIRRPETAKAQAQAKTGKSGAQKNSSTRGRPVGHSSRPPYDGARPDISATLRTAIPWQRIRNRDLKTKGWTKDTRIRILPSDFKYIRYRHRSESTAIFAVDASGSTALARLAEAKGAIELLLADCYVRRDNVALVAFRGAHAETLLEPTRSLVRAKRSLTGLPGGGPTPLANGIQRSLELAGQARQRGQTPLIVYLTDGNGNIALDGRPDRKQAAADARKLAEAGAVQGFRSVLIDIAARPRPAAKDLAQAMRADYCALPHVSATAVSTIVGRYLSDQHG
ncbi:MAG: VWA domain-containing protein [Roseibium sp.]|nr:VWA domain-containing protein [Roseibium sp.]